MPKPRRLRVLLAAILVVLATMRPGAAAEETETDDDLRPESPESVLYETATVHARPLASTTAPVTVLDREQIESLGVASAAELIRFVPGLDLVSTGGRGGLATAQVRGGEANFTVVLVDGVPLNDETDQSRGGAVNLNSLPTAHVERIEIVRGPLSSFFGSRAIGGAINIITRRGEQGHEWAAGAAGGDNAVLQAHASVGSGGERQRYFVGASWEQEEGAVAEEEFAQLAVQGSFEQDLGDSTELQLTGRLTSWDTEDYPDLSGGPVYGDGETRDTDNEEASLGLEVGFGRPERQHRVAVKAFRHELDRATPAIDTAGIPPSSEETTFTDVRAAWTWPAIVRDRMRLDVGAEVNYQRGRNDSAFFFPGFEVPGSYEIDRTTGATFVELGAEVSRVLFELGVRLDVPEGFDTELSPRAGVTYRFPNDATRLRFSAGRGFKLPSFFVLASPPLLGGNPDLEPETAWGGDLEVSHQFTTADLFVSLAGFAYRYEDLIDFIDLAPEDDLLFIPLAVNRAEVDTQGAELTLSLRPIQAVTLQANVTYQDVEDAETGERLRNRPEWVGGLRLGWQATERLEWTLDGQWVTEALDFFVPAAGTDTVDGYPLLGTALHYDVTDAIGLHARVDNVLDEDYETFVGFPGPGRRFRAGFSYRSRPAASP